MGRITKGILGGFSGKVGTVVGSTWKGIDYMRSRSTKKKGTSSPLQLEQQQKFRAASKFNNSMSALLASTFAVGANRMTGQNNALSYTLRNAVTGTVNNFTIDYTIALVSRGDLPNAQGITAVKSGTDVQFSWTDNSGQGRANAADAGLLVVYCPALGQTVYNVGGRQRADAGASLDCSQFAGNTVHAYLAFEAVDGKGFSNSVYAGSVAL